MVDELDDYEEQQMDENFRKLQLWQARKIQKAGAQRQQVLEQEVFESVAKEFGLTPQELQNQIATVESPEEQQEIEEHFKDRLKNYWRERASLKTKKVAGNKLQDERGRFTSPKKQASEREYQKRISEMKERVSRGGRLSDDELLEIMPRLR
jgi:hypothetical protein